MNRFVASIGIALALAILIKAGPLAAQPAPAAKSPAKASATDPAPASAAKAAPGGAARAVDPDARSPYRRLVPGVIQEIDPQRTYDETNSRHNVVELIAIDPAFDFAKDATFRHDIWMLSFKFKPVRMIWVDVPQQGGRMQRKLIWYMIYSVTNSGKVMHPVEDENKTFTMVTVDKPVRFNPVFVLEAHSRLQDETAGFTKAYTDRYIPVALAPIRNREDPKRSFLSTPEMPRTEIAVGQTVWGIATWENVDPRTVWFSVYIEGLTNGYRWVDNPGEYKAGDSIGIGRRMMRRMLKLNFWRAGDPYYEKETEVRYGIPGRQQYEWVYRP
jgi:hypothetical protein